MRSEVANVPDGVQSFLNVGRRPSGADEFVEGMPGVPLKVATPV
jgi:hypothetical protein